MQYFATGEDNGGAGERRLGPFDTAEEAQAAGQKETKDSNGGFVFRGIVDEANNQVLTAGDVALNAKFKVGDRVKLAGTISPGLGKTGVVVKVDGEWGDVTVKTDDGKTYQSEASAVQKVANSTRINSVRTSCPVVANAIAANKRVARNADERIAEKFSRSIEGTIHKGERPSWSVTIYIGGLVSPYSRTSAEDCVKKCEDAIRNLDEKKQGLVKAIAWLKKNA